MTPLDEIRAKLIAPRTLRGGQRIRLRCGLQGEYIAAGPLDGQATILLEEFGSLELVVCASKLEITP